MLAPNFLLNRTKELLNVMKHSYNQKYKHGNYKLYKSKLFSQNRIFILAELAKYLSPVNQQKWLILNLSWQGSLDLYKENRWVRKSQFGTVGNFWKPKSIWVHSHNVSCFHMLLLDAQCLGESHPTLASPINSAQNTQYGYPGSTWLWTPHLPFWWLSGPHLTCLCLSFLTC